MCGPSISCHTLGTHDLFSMTNQHDVVPCITILALFLLVSWCLSESSLPVNVVFVSRPICPGYTSPHSPPLTLAPPLPPCRQRSGAELWALVRQFAADKKTPGRSLYLLSRDKEYSLVGHVFSQLFPDDYDRVRGRQQGGRVHGVVRG